MKITLNPATLSVPELNDFADEFAAYAASQYEWLKALPNESGKDLLRGRASAARDVATALNRFANFRRENL